LFKPETVKELLEIPMSFEFPQSLDGEAKLDPEPVAVVTLCMGAAMLVNAVANTFINYRKHFRDEDHRREDSEVEFLSKADALKAAGERLLHTIKLIEDNGETAFRLIGPRAEFRPVGDELSERIPLTLRAGETSIEVSRDERQGWNALVTSTTRTIDLLNGNVETYEEALLAVLASGRKLNSISALGVDSLIGNVVDLSVSFQKALDSYHTLRASTPIEECERRFTRVMYAAEAMVNAANGFLIVSVAMLNQKNRRSE
jgi:hypothetical protein